MRLKRTNMATATKAERDAYMNGANLAAYVMRQMVQGKRGLSRNFNLLETFLYVQNYVVDKAAGMVAEGYDDAAIRRALLMKMSDIVDKDDMKRYARFCKARDNGRIGLDGTAE